MSRAPTRHFVAVKVYSSDARNTEFAVDKVLQSFPGSHQGKRHVELALDSFLIHGPSGQHVCRVLEPVGRSLHSIIQERFERRCDLNEPKPWLGSAVQGDGWSIQSAKKICWQILEGLHYLHSRRVAHRDIQLGNICAALRYNLDSLSENEIQTAIWHTEEQHNSPLHETQTPVIWSDSDSETDSIDSTELERQRRIEETKRQEKEDKYILEQQWKFLMLDPGDPLAAPHSAEWNTANFLNTRNQSHIDLIRQKDGSPLDKNPRKLQDIHYTIEPKPLDDGFDLENDFRFVLIDLGFACSFDECEKQSAPGGVFDFMSPEHMLDLPTTFKGDIYSLGLVFWKVVMLRSLVEQRMNWDDPNFSRNRRLRDLAQRLGPVPPTLRAQWDKAEDFVDADGYALDNLLEMDGREYEPDEFEYGDIWHQALSRKPLDMSTQDMEAFVNLITEMLQWIPESRPSTLELLKHAWFKEFQ